MGQPEQELEAIHLTLPVVWVGTDELPVNYINNFIVQVDNGEIFLTLGTMVPPPLIGTPAEQKDQADRLGAVTVKPVLRAAMTPARARELHNNLERIIAVHDQQVERLATDDKKDAS